MLYKLRPALSLKLWGGYKLSSIYKLNRDKIGEAWIMSALGSNSSLIDNKRTLLDLFNENKNIVKEGYQGEFPLLVKLIDAADDLSIQVHPDAKTECWHILSKNPSKLYLGLNKNCSKCEIEDILNNGDITDVLNYIDERYPATYLLSSPGDFLVGNVEPMEKLLKERGVICSSKIYGDSSVQHVFFCDIKTELAKEANEDQASFLKAHID